MTADHEWGFRTRALHAGGAPDPTTGARAVPIYQSTSFVFEDTADAADLFALQKFGTIYTRISNPTTAVFEERIASLEGGVGALLVASGQAAETIAILNVAEAGDHIVASPSLYGGTFNLLKHTLPKFGIEVTFVDDPADAAFAACTSPWTYPNADLPEPLTPGDPAERHGAEDGAEAGGQGWQARRQAAQDRAAGH